MSIDLVARVLKANIRPASHKLALVQLAEGTNQRTGVVWRSIASVAACLGVTQRQAKRVIGQLQTDGVLLVLANRKGGQPGSVPVYQINDARLIELTPACPKTGDTNVIVIGTMRGHSVPRTGDLDVTPVRHSGSETGDMEVRDGCHPCPETGDMDVTRTGIGTGNKPKDARAHADAREGFAQVSPECQNSRHQDQVSAATAEVDVAAVRQKLREMAEQIRQASDAGKSVRRLTYG